MSSSVSNEYTTALLENEYQFHGQPSSSPLPNSPPPPYSPSASDGIDSACVSAPVSRAFRFDRLAVADADADASRRQQQTRPSWSAPPLPHLLPPARASAYGQPSGPCRGGLATVPLAKPARALDGALADPNSTCSVNAEPKLLAVAIQQQNMIDSDDAFCWAIFTTLCCCCVCGLAAIYYALAARRRASAAVTATDGGEQRRAEVRELHRRAKCCVKAGVMAGVGMMVALALIYACLLLVIIYNTASAPKRGARKLPVQKISPR